MHINNHIPSGIRMTQQKSLTTKNRVCFIELRILKVNGPERSTVYNEVFIMKRSNNYQSSKIRNPQGKKNEQRKHGPLQSQGWNQVP